MRFHPFCSMVQVITVNISLRAFLLICALLVLFFVFRKIKKSEFEISDSIFWFIFVAVLAVLAIFPQIAFSLSSFLGFVSPSNFIFLVVIAVLLIRVFSLNAELAHLRAKVNGLIQEIALREHERPSD